MIDRKRIENRVRAHVAAHGTSPAASVLALEFHSSKEGILWTRRAMIRAADIAARAGGAGRDAVKAALSSPDHPRNWWPLNRQGGCHKHSRADALKWIAEQIAAGNPVTRDTLRQRFSISASTAGAWWRAAGGPVGFTRSSVAVKVKYK